MIKDGSDIRDPEDEYFHGSPDEDIDFELDDDEDDFEENDDRLPCIEPILGAIFLSRPLGILWDDDIIEEFLSELGYSMIERVDDDGDVYVVPVKKGSKLIPDRRDSLRRVFDREIQKVLLKWLIKQSKE